MMSSREQLLGYLLGALEADEQREVEEHLDDHPGVQRELEFLRSQLKPLECLPRYAPPAGLAERTCDLVLTRAAPKRHGAADALDARELPETLAPATLETRRSLAAAPLFSDSAPAGSVANESVVEPADVSSGRRWSVSDCVVGAGICVAAAVLLFPLMGAARSYARRIECEENLRQFGAALVSYSELAPGRYFPHVPAEGKHAFVGVVAPVLRDQGLLPDSSILLCPNSPLARERVAFRVPALADFESHEGAELRRLKRMALGSLGYTLGVVVNGEHRAPRNQGRPFFVVASDAPPSNAASRGHGDGQNLLFEDGHVEFLLGDRSPRTSDHIYQNRRGLLEAGVDENDAVIGSSETSPFLK